METRPAVLNAAFRRSGDALMAAVEPSDRRATRTRTERWPAAAQGLHYPSRLSFG
jgi:hypothetical protein